MVVTLSKARRLLPGALLLLAACGQQPPVTTQARTQAAPAPVPVAPTPPPPSNQQVARELAGKAIATFGQLKTFRATAVSTDNDPKNQETYKSAVEVQFRAPNRFRLQVLPGYDNAGLKLAFDDGGDKITVRLSGVLGVAKIHLGLDDSRARTSRGFPFMGITIKGTLSRLGDPRAVVGYLGDTVVEGKNCHVLGVTGGVLLPTVTEERVFFEKGTFLPVRAEERIGAKIVFSSTLKDLQPNAPIAPDAFNI